MVELDTLLEDGPIIVFDALCVLCSANVQFVLKYDRNGHFRLASMQDEIGTALYRRCGIDPEHPDTLVVVEKTGFLRDSDAIIAIYAGLGWPWRALLIGHPVPRALRDPVYRLIARNRYRLFGKREHCWLPTKEQASRVL